VIFGALVEVRAGLAMVTAAEVVTTLRLALAVALIEQVTAAPPCTEVGVKVRLVAFAMVTPPAAQVNVSPVIVSL
jgi:hypothetical protein